MRSVPGVLVFLLILGCAGTAGELGEGSVVADEDLAATLEVKLVDGAVRLVFHVTNMSAAPIPFTFPSSQRSDFAVVSATGEREWQWSSTRSFAQVVTEATLGRGETWVFEASWPPGDRSGVYEARAWVTATPRRVEQRMTFELP